MDVFYFLAAEVYLNAVGHESPLLIPLIRAMRQVLERKDPHDFLLVPKTLASFLAMLHEMECEEDEGGVDLTTNRRGIYDIVPYLEAKRLEVGKLAKEIAEEYERIIEVESDAMMHMTELERVEAGPLEAVDFSKPLTFEEQESEEEDEEQDNLLAMVLYSPLPTPPTSTSGGRRNAVSLTVDTSVARHRFLTVAERRNALPPTIDTDLTRQYRERPPRILIHAPSPEDEAGEDEHSSLLTANGSCEAQDWDRLSRAVEMEWNDWLACIEREWDERMLFPDQL